MTKATLPTQLNSNIGGTKKVYSWNFLGKQYQIVYETIGQGNPVLIILAENAPPKSKAEMLAMVELERVIRVELPGTLGIYEEYPKTVTEAIQNFI